MDGQNLSQESFIMLRLKITRPGVFLMVKNALQEMEIGEIVSVEGEVIPVNMVNKCEIVGDSQGLPLTADNAGSDELKSALAKAKTGYEAQEKTISGLRAENAALALELDGLKKAKSDEAEYSLLEAQEKYKALAKKDPDKRWGLESLLAEIARMEAV